LAWETDEKIGNGRLESGDDADIGFECLRAGTGWYIYTVRNDKSSDTGACDTR